MAGLLTLKGSTIGLHPSLCAAKYMRGLMSLVGRKNGWQLAEAMGDKRPDATQRLLYHAKWEADEARDELQRYIIENWGDEEGIGVVDETGFLKKGNKSVGVKRQYSGTAGKVDNCQVGVFLSYTMPKGQVLLDRRLYLQMLSGARKRRCPKRSPFRPSRNKRWRCWNRPGSGVCPCGG